MPHLFLSDFEIHSIAIEWRATHDAERSSHQLGEIGTHAIGDIAVISQCDVLFARPYDWSAVAPDFDFVCVSCFC